jgi:signal transduction histidine kinase
MNGKLLPKHYGFAILFVKLRWIAIILLFISAYFVKNIMDIDIRENPIYVLSLILFVINFSYLLHLKTIIKDDPSKIQPKIRFNINAQVTVDLILLTLILHFSGGIENPFIIYYIFHMIIASAILTPKESYVQTGVALLLIGIMAFLECFNVVPHYPLKGFVTHDLYKNSFYLFGTGFVFVTTSFMVVGLVNSLVSRSRKIETAYLNTNAELQQKDKLKNEYVLHLTHDMKGHLAAIISCLSVVKNKTLGPVNEKQEEFITMAYDRTNLLTDFIKDLLNLTKRRIEKSTEIERFSVDELVTKVINALKVNAGDKSILLHVEMDDNISLIEGNAFSIEEVFSNLLLNAIKYTPENGHIWLTGKNRFDQVIFEITDDGIGIPENDIPRVFDEFFRASNVKKDSKSGTGLGLSIVKQIISDHHGRIWVESKLGKGTKFTFRLPKNQPVSINPLSDIETLSLPEK